MKGAPLVLAFTACGGGADPVSPGSALSTQAQSGTVSDVTGQGPESTTTPTQVVAADRLVAEAALLTLSEFPAGWSEVPNADSTASDEELDRLHAECLGGSLDEMVDTGAQAETGTFTSPSDGSTIAEVVALAETVDAAVVAISRYGDADAIECLETAYNEVFNELVAAQVESEDFSVGEITVSSLMLAPVGDERHAFRIEVPMTVRSIPVTSDFVIVATRVDRSLAGLFFFSPDGATPIEWVNHYASQAASRLPG